MSEKQVEILNAKECEIIARNALKLGEAESVKILSYALSKGMHELIGFMGEYFKLNIELENAPRENHMSNKCMLLKRIIHTNQQHSGEGTKKLCFFVKSVPIANELHRAECERKNFFQKESCAYTKILPNIQKYATTKLYPECFYARKDLLVLEDLTELGYRHLERDEIYTNKHRKLFLTHMAQLHAGSIAWEEKEGVKIEEHFKEGLFELMLATDNDWYMTSAKGIIFLAKNYLPSQTPEVQTLINEKLFTLLVNVERYTEPSKRMRNVFLHRDSWDRNIFFKFDAKGEPLTCSIVDFQLSRYATPSLDMLFFLYGQTTTEERKSYMQDYIDHYYAALTTRFRELGLPSDIITKLELMEDVRRAHLPALIIMAITKPLTLMPEGISNKWRAEEQEKFDYYMNTHRDELFQRVMAIDPTYEANIMRPIEELIEYLQQNPDLME